MIRVMAPDESDNLLLGRVVDLGHEVVTTLGRDRERLEAVQASDDDFAGAARGAYCNIEKRVHVE
jgi:hypothetical protein